MEEVQGATEQAGEVVCLPVAYISRDYYTLYRGLMNWKRGDWQVHIWQVYIDSLTLTQIDHWPHGHALTTLVSNQHTHDTQSKVRLYGRGAECDL